MTTKKLLQNIETHDKTLSLVFAGLSLLFIVSAFTVPAFMDWVFARHENILSWYVRPLFLIPFCFFAYYRSLTGISLTIFLLLTSMFWFPQPADTPESVKEFLTFEKQYLLSDWNVAKVAMTLLVPLTMAVLAYSFWKRNLWLGFSTMAAIAVLKSAWSLLFGGQGGAAVLIPAAIGLATCAVFIYLGLRLQKARKHPQRTMTHPEKTGIT